MNTRYFPFLFLAALTLLALRVSTEPAQADAQIIYVNAGAGAAGDGQTWGTAYLYLQDALDDANSDGVSDYEIWVAHGIYYPDQDRDGDHASGVVSETFRISYNNVQLYGGFAGTETAREQRDWASNVTVLSGDVDRNDTTNSDGVVEDTANISGSNAYHVLYLDGVTNEPITNTIVIDGFTITAGQANGDAAIYHDDGAGLFCMGNGSGNECSPVLTNITFSGNLAAGGGGALRNNGYSSGKSNPILTDVDFTNNSALSGGAMYNSGNASGESSPVLTNVTFTNNSSSGSGGAMYNYGYYSGKSSPVLTHVTFTNNAAGVNGGAMSDNGDQGNSHPVLTYVTFIGNSADGNGGAMYNYGDNGNTNPTLTHVTFDNNSAGGSGGAMHNHAWAAAGDSNPVLTDVIFTNNSAEAGGAMYNIGTNDGRASPLLTNVAFYNNSASGNGGALLNYGYSGHSNPVLTNVVFSGNTAESGGAMRTYGSHGDSRPVLTNVTFYGNAAEWGGAMSTASYLGEGDPVLRNVILWGNTASSGGAQMYNSSAGINVSYSIIEGGWDGDGIYNDSSVVYDGGGNLDLDPQFMHAQNGDLHLQPTSPAIDAGNNDAIPIAVTTDLDGKPRFVDFPPEGGTGNGTSPFVDIGAYEMQTDVSIYLPLVVK